MIAKTLWIAGALLVIANLLLLAVNPTWFAGVVTLVCGLACVFTYEETWKD
jgi:hypothetical protein